MRAESAILGGVAAFLVVAATVYWFWSYEDAGTVLLALGAAFAGMVAVYLRRESRRLPAPGGPEEEDLGWFPTASIWPLGTGGGAVLVGLGLVFGIWLTLIGAALLAASVLGYALADRNQPSA